jgi:hypothetical protein
MTVVEEDTGELVSELLFNARVGDGGGSSCKAALTTIRTATIKQPTCAVVRERVTIKRDR